MEFVKGKWYLIGNCGVYLKYSKTFKKQLYFSEAIRNNEWFSDGDLFDNHCNFKEVEISEISQWLPENHCDKQLKPEDFIGKWVTSDIWSKDSYIYIKDFEKDEEGYGVNTDKTAFIKHNISSYCWTIRHLSDLTIVSEEEVAKKAIEYGHDLRELGLHQFNCVKNELLIQKGLEIHKKVFQKEDLYNTKIWIGNNEKLNKKVQERLFELGFSWKKNNEYKKNIAYIYLYSDDFINKSRDNYKEYELTNYREFCFFDNKEITLSDLGINLINNNPITPSECFKTESIQIIPVTKTNNINIPDIKLNNLKLTI